MNDRNQAMLLLHERLHSLAYTDHQNIINITTGIFTALDLYRQQSLTLQSKPNAQFSDFTPMTSQQMTILQNMFTSIVSMNYLRDGTPPNEDGGHWAIEPNGGGIYFLNPDLDTGALVNDNATVSHIAFIGAGSVLGKQGSIADDGIMINSSCFTSACSIGTGASMIESSASAIDENAQKFKVVLDPTAQINGSQIDVNSPDSSAVVHLAASASVMGSVVQGVQGLQVEAAAVLEKSLFSFNSSDGSLVSLDLKAGSTTNGVSANLIVRGAASPTNIFMISVPANQQFQMKTPFQCVPGFIPTISSNTSLTDVTSLNNLCKSILTPELTH